MGFLNDNSTADQVAKRFNQANLKGKGNKDNDKTNEELRKAKTNGPEGTERATAGRAAQGEAGKRPTLSDRKPGGKSPQQPKGKR